MAANHGAMGPFLRYYYYSCRSWAHRAVRFPTLFSGLEVVLDNEKAGRQVSGHLEMKSRLLPALALAAAALIGAAQPAYAGAWVYPKGVSWSPIGFAYQNTDERYFLDGERIPYFFDGQSEVTATFFEYRLGLGAGFEALAPLPVYNIRFDDLADDRSSTGIGDVRAGAHWNFVQDTVVATVGAAVKFPTGEFVNDAEIVPVGEGRYDFEVDVEVGRSLWPRPGYVNGKLSYRFRTENEENGIDPGDEIFWSFEGGYRWIPSCSRDSFAGSTASTPRARALHCNAAARDNLRRTRSDLRDLPHAEYRVHGARQRPRAKLAGGSHT